MKAVYKQLENNSTTSSLTILQAKGLKHLAAVLNLKEYGNFPLLYFTRVIPTKVQANLGGSRILIAFSQGN